MWAHRPSSPHATPHGRSVCGRVARGEGLEGGLVHAVRHPHALRVPVPLLEVACGEGPVGLVRLRVKKASEELARVIDAMIQKQQTAGGPSVFAEITDEDIDNLFND